MRAAATVALALGFLGLMGCEDQPCDRYVNYVCDCHDGEEGFDCDELSIALSDADPAAQDQCAIDLADLEAEDDANGVECILE